VKQWRQDARARGVVIARPKYRHFSNNPRGRGPGPQSCTAHWAEMIQWLEAHPDQAAVELLTEFQARYPGCYTRSHPAYVAPSRAGLAPRGYSAIDLQHARPYTQCQLRNDSVSGHGQFEPHLCRLRRQTGLRLTTDRRLSKTQSPKARTPPVTSVMRRPVTKLCDAIRY
jgi:hypothetical protein